MRGHPIPAKIPEQTGREGLARWRELTREANAAFDRRQHLLALRLYGQALQRAEQLLAGPGLSASPDDCLAALVVAHHNLSDAHRRDGDSAAALDHLCAPHETLTRIVSDAAAPGHVRLAAVRHLGEARFALLLWQGRHGACARTDALLEASLPAVESIGAEAPRH